MKTVKTAVLAAAVCALAACAHGKPQSEEEALVVAQYNLEQLEPGLSRQAVADLLKGRPVRRDDAAGTEVYRIWRKDDAGGTFVCSLTVFYRPAGRLSAVRWEHDGCYRKPSVPTERMPPRRN